MSAENERTVFQTEPEKWPHWLTDAEMQKVIRAAKEGENAKRDTLLTAAVLYLGLTPEEAAGIRYCTANGDAIENRNIYNRALLHIPNEYRRMINEALGEQDSFYLLDRLTDCAAADAAEAIAQVFDRAGLPKKNAAIRLRRTAARLHYLKGWTPERELFNWFSDIDSIPDENKTFYYREKTDKDE